MSVPVLTFFNNKGGVGTTSLVYHLTWMLSELGRTVLAVDLDAQADLTAAFLDEDELERLWERAPGPTTIYRAIEPLTHAGDVLEPNVVKITPELFIIPGEVALASVEDLWSESWPKSLSDTNLNLPYRILTSFWQVAQLAAHKVSADIILVDVGPNLGAINRSALIGSDYLAIPLGADIFSLQGLLSLGPALRSWRAGWQRRLAHWTSPDFPLPQGEMRPLGYLVQQPAVRLSRPPITQDKWVNRMPSVYHQVLLDGSTSADKLSQDEECLATLGHYRSLISMSQEARKPIFKLSTADGAIGGHAQAVQAARKDFKSLAEKLLARMNL